MSEELNPITRKEMFLAKIIGNAVETPEPITREEMFLDQIAKNGSGGGGGADWNAAEGQPGYVANRTHYEYTETVNEPLNITWDGNTEGLVSANKGFYKVSNIVIANNEDVKTLVYKHSQVSTESTLETLWDDMVNNGLVTEDGVIGMFVNVVRKDGATFNYMGNELVFSEKGIYFMGMDAHIEYAYSTDPIELIKPAVKPIDPKYLPAVSDLDADWLDELKTALGLSQ